MENVPLPCVADRRAVEYPKSGESGACAWMCSLAVLLSMLCTKPPRLVMLEMASPTYWEGTTTVTFITGSIYIGPADWATLSKHMAAQASKANSLAVSS